MSDLVHTADQTPAARPTSHRTALSRHVGRGLRASLPALDATLSLRLTSDSAGSWRDPVGLAGPFGSIEFSQGTRLLRALSGIDLRAAKEDDECAQWLQAALVGRLAGTPFFLADRVVRAASADMQDACVFRVTLKSEKHAFSTHARAAAPTWLDFLEHGEWERARSAASRHPNVPFEAVVRVARHTLPEKALAGLTIGDIVLPDSPAFTCDGEGTINISGVTLPVRHRSPCTLEIIGEGSVVSSDGEPPIENATRSTFNAADEFVSSGDGLDAPDSPPVTLDFELGKTNISMKEARALGTGATLLLTSASSASIAITADGRLLGRGEVVNVDDRLGIRIIQWGAS